MNKDYFFADFTEKDYSAIEKLWELTGIGSPERADSPKSIITCNTLGGKFICLKRKKDSGIIGTSWMSFDGRRIYLHHFCIHPDYQNQGLGTLLGRESLKFIKKKGFQVKLEVHKENIPAKKLYKKLGFFAFTDYDIYMIRNFH